MEVCLHDCVHIKTITWKFRILNLKNSRVIYLPVKFVNFLKSRLIFNISIVSECLWTNFSHILHAHISKIKSVLKWNLQTHYFHMRTKILADFQICISAPLKGFMKALKAFIKPYEGLWTLSQRINDNKHLT